MVGWSRRSSESNARRQRWWATLTPEEKAAHRAREAEADRKFFFAMKIFFPVMITVLVVTLLLEHCK